MSIFDGYPLVTDVDVPEGGYDEQGHLNNVAVLAFMGPGLLRELQRPSQWRINIQAVRQKLACRHERRAK